MEVSGKGKLQGWGDIISKIRPRFACFYCESSKHETYSSCPFKWKSIFLSSFRFDFFLLHNTALDLCR